MYTQRTPTYAAIPCSNARGADGALIARAVVHVLSVRSIDEDVVVFGQPQKSFKLFSEFLPPAYLLLNLLSSWLFLMRKRNALVRYHSSVWTIFPYLNFAFGTPPRGIYSATPTGVIYHLPEILLQQSLYWLRHILGSTV